MPIHNKSNKIEQFFLITRVLILAVLIVALSFSLFTADKVNSIIHTLRSSSVAEECSKHSLKFGDKLGSVCASLDLIQITAEKYIEETKGHTFKLIVIFGLFFAIDLSQLIAKRINAKRINE